MLKFRRSNTSTPNQEDNHTMQDVRDRAQVILQDIGESFSMNMSRDDVKSPRFWRAVLAELLGTLILVLFGCGSWIETDVEEHPLTVRIAMTFGLMYAVILYCLRPVSGGHINPTVTIAIVVTRQISLARAVFYCLAQVIGGILGAALLLAFTPAPYRDHLGCTKTAMELSAGQGFGIELFISFFYVFVVFSCYAKVDKADMIVYNLFTPFAIGFTAITTHLFAIPFTGASLNPARSFGPAIVTGNWDNHWLYWFGPIIGGTLGGVLQQTAFGKKASLRHLTTCMTSHETDDGGNDKLPTTMASLPSKPQPQPPSRTGSRGGGSVIYSGSKRNTTAEIFNETQSQSSNASSKKSLRQGTSSHIRSNKISDGSLPSMAVAFPPQFAINISDAPSLKDSTNSLPLTAHSLLNDVVISGNTYGDDLVRKALQQAKMQSKPFEQGIEESNGNSSGRKLGLGEETRLPIEPKPKEMARKAIESLSQSPGVVNMAPSRINSDQEQHQTRPNTQVANAAVQTNDSVTDQKTYYENMMKEHGTMGRKQHEDSITDTDKVTGENMKDEHKSISPANLIQETKNTSERQVEQMLKMYPDDELASTVDEEEIQNKEHEFEIKKDDRQDLLKDIDACSDLTNVTPLPAHMIRSDEEYDDADALSDSSADIDIPDRERDITPLTPEEERAWQEQSSIDGSRNRLFPKGDHPKGITRMDGMDTDEDGSPV